MTETVTAAPPVLLAASGIEKAYTRGW